ncbi:hypothetical protein NQ317_014583 [Molorchus minor]|uniref:Tubulin-folding cofactor D C-terminal domain-containing protein n=1 Tax=Molorchus minor TaxID=1323400 RepID=A0ABQ9ISP5_9CUCU|nr:hypothetical protein NQ317_014583 [Molorchus minor]
MFSGLTAFSRRWYCGVTRRILFDARQHPKTNDLIVKYVTDVLSTTNQVTRMGHALALGVLPKFMLQPNLNNIIFSLIESTIITPATVKWAESRRDAVKALTSICATMASDIGQSFTEAHALKIYHTFLEGLNDYTQDKRGDIGAWMREGSVTGLQTLTLLLTKHLPEILTQDLTNRILSGIAQQAVEKSTVPWALAGKVFYSFIYNNPPIPNISHYHELSLIFPKDECDMLNWNSASSTFPKFVQLISLPPYTYNVMLGLICSKKSSHSLFTFLKSEIKSKGIVEIRKMCDVTYKIFSDHQKNDRITIPMFRFLDKLFDSGCLNLIIEDKDSDFIRKILKLIQMEIAGCKDIYKLIDGINVLCQFIQIPDVLLLFLLQNALGPCLCGDAADSIAQQQFHVSQFKSHYLASSSTLIFFLGRVSIKGEVCDIALVQLSILLCHRQSYVRRSTSTKLYESLLVNGDSSNIKPENLDDVMQVLSNTNWEDTVEQVKPIRNELCKLMGTRIPVPMKKKT